MFTKNFVRAAVFLGLVTLVWSRPGSATLDLAPAPSRFSEDVVVTELIPTVQFHSTNPRKSAINRSQRVKVLRGPRV